jgi:AcrR family transcriptional regulator
MTVKRGSTYRQEQAAATRLRISAAARALFRDVGFVATTIESIASAAGVSVATVYAVFRSKLGILAALRDEMIQAADISRLMEEAAQASDVGRRLELWARSIRLQMETSYDVISIHRQAARADPAFAKEYKKVLDERSRHFAGFAAGLRDALRPGVDVELATDVLWALANEELYREFVAERGWTPDRYEAWLSRTLREQLVGGRRR